MSRRPIDLTEVIAAVAELVVLPFLGRRRAADMEMFALGTLNEGIDGRGRPTVKPSFSVHVQAPWRIICDGRLMVGSRDMRDPPNGVPSGGCELQVLPDSVDEDDESWRLLRPNGCHLVVGGDGLTPSAG